MKGRVELFWIVFVVLLMGTINTYGQKESAIWYFGQNAGLDFREHYPLPLTDGMTSTPEGVASVSDSLGNLLFYTDGMTIWNKNHGVMASGLSADSAATHAATIIPNRSNPNKYFVFTTSSITSHEDDNYGGNYYIVDFTNTELGEVIYNNAEETGIPGILRNSTEKLAAVPYMQDVEDGPNIPAYRLLMHEYLSDTFAHFNLDSLVTDYRQQAIGSWHLDSLEYIGTGANGQIKMSMQGDRVAVAMEGERRFEVYDFDKETGELSNPIFLMAGDREHGKTEFARAAYGVEFSPSGRFLYGTARDNGYVYQWDLSIRAVAEMRATIHFVRSNPEQNCGALQLAPNGKIYIAMEGADYLGVINSPNLLGKRCDFEEYGVRLLDNETNLGGFSGVGLPVAIPTGRKAEAFYYNNTCLGETTSFFITDGTGMQSPFFAVSRWDDGSFVANVSGVYNSEIGTFLFEYVFAEPGDYKVVLTALRNRVPVQYTRKLTIHSPPENYWPQDTIICTGQTLDLDAGNGAFYYWVEAGARDRNLLVDSLGKNPITGSEYLEKRFRVFVTHYNGCLTKDSILVKRKFPPVLTYETSEARCNEPNGSATVIPTGRVENHIYSWDDFPEVTSNTISDIPGGDYGVHVTSMETGCESYIEIPVIAKGSVRIVPSIDSIVCPGTQVKLTAENADFFDWVIPEGNFGADVYVTPEETTEYWVLGTSISPGDTCISEYRYTVEVAPDNSPELGDDRSACFGDTINIEGPEGYLEYDWNSGSDSRIIDVYQDKIPLVLTVRDTNYCYFSDEIDVTFNTLPEINVTTNKALCGQLNGSASVVPAGNPDDYIFEWEGFPENTSNKIFDLGAGQYRVNVTSILTGCDTLIELSVSEFGAPEILITASYDEAICPGTEISLTASNADSYTWDDPDFTRGEQITVNPYTETIYSVVGVTTDEEGNECKSYADFTVPVLPYNKPDLGQDLEACEGDTLNIEGQDQYIDWNWSNGMTGQNIRINQNEPELVLTATDENECFVTDTIALTFHPYPNVFLGEDKTLCTNDPVVLWGGTGDSYLWNTDETSEEISVMEKGTFWLEIETAGCASRDSITLQLVNPDSIRIDSVVVKDISCYGEVDGEIMVFAQGSGDSYTYSIDGGQNYFDNSGHFDSLPASDTYVITVLEDSVCSRNYPDVLGIVEPSEIETQYRLTSPSCEGCIDGEINLTLVDGGSPPFTFLWDDLSTEEKRLDIGTGNYSVNITDSRGCFTELFFELDLSYRIPNAFTPNDDGINDLWTIGIIEYHPDAIVKVFDRVGKLVFESAKGYPEPWDGKYEDDFLPMGTYYYLIYLNEDDKPEKGIVTIVR